MVVDSSAIMAILLNEEDAEVYERSLALADAAFVSSATALESALVLEQRLGSAAEGKLDALLVAGEIQVVAFDSEQLTLARLAYRRFGRGRHPAQLNFGDCFAYALAKHLGEPLLYKGGDFSQTDIASALAV